MSAAAKSSQVSVDDYLAGELRSSIKHEYLGGYVYAMAGAKNAHNIVATNVVGSLHAQLRGKRCRPFNSDTKIRVKLPTHVRFYYPDASVVCDQNPADDSFQDRPVVVVEVLSEGTRRVDFGEKKDAYLTIPTLQTLVLFEQSRAAATVYRRAEQGFVEESYGQPDDVIPLGEIEAELPLADVFEGVEFIPDADEENL
jgi:Uma2 family endonuclease